MSEKQGTEIRVKNFPQVYLKVKANVWVIARGEKTKAVFLWISMNYQSVHLFWKNSPGLSCKAGDAHSLWMSMTTAKEGHCCTWRQVEELFKNITVPKSHKEGKIQMSISRITIHEMCSVLTNGTFFYKNIHKWQLSAANWMTFQTEDWIKKSSTRIYTKYDSAYRKSWK